MRSRTYHADHETRQFFSSFGSNPSVQIKVKNPILVGKDIVPNVCYIFRNNKLRAAYIVKSYVSQFLKVILVFRYVITLYVSKIIAVVYKVGAYMTENHL